MSSVQYPLNPPVVGKSNYSLIMYATPRLILYNPYNVTLSIPGSSPFTAQLGTNQIGRSWSINVGSQAVQTNKTIGWGGTVSGGGGGINLLTDPAANFILKPGEIRVYGLTTLKQVNPGGLTFYDGGTSGSFTRPKLGNTVGQSTWQYVPPDVAPPAGAPGDSTRWETACNDTDHVVVSINGAQGFGSNDGTYNLVNIPALWPNTSTSSTKALGRFFARFFNNEKSQSVDLGTIGNMAAASASSSAAQQFGYFVLRVKGLTQSQTNASVLSPTPMFSSCDGAFNPLPYFFDCTMEDVDFSLSQNPTSKTAMQITTGVPANSYWGGQDTALSANDPSFLVLADVPRQPMVSLGQFMHMAIRNSMFVSVNSHNQGLIDENNCMMGVGGSLADPFFPLSQTNNDTVSKQATFFNDDNFVMNQGLFDTYYFSTVPPAPANMDASYKAVLPAMATSPAAFNDANVQNGTCVLPNSRMSFYRKNGAAPVTSTASAQNYLPDYRKVSANLLLNGAFNVNSTSISAWRALFSSPSGNAVSYLNSSGGGFSPASIAASQYPIFRFLSPVMSGTSAVTSYANPYAWAGINLLSESSSGSAGGLQLTSLATQIVQQVKLRGPFLSMADFLNRRLDPNPSPSSTTSLGYKGALQAAIDNTNINQPLLTSGGGMTTGPTIQGSRGPGDPTAIAGQYPTNTLVGVPGWLMQQDLVQSSSPVMTVRSDTFLVRCYGEADNTTSSAIEGRAWGEAVIQRLPDFVDQNDPALKNGSNLGDATPIASLTSGINQTFGRRFKVVSFRWLNESDL